MELNFSLIKKHNIKISYCVLSEILMRSGCLRAKLELSESINIELSALPVTKSLTEPSFSLFPLLFSFSSAIEKKEKSREETLVSLNKN